MKLETKLIHAGEARPRFAGAVNVPIFQSSTFEYAGQGKYEDLKYIRLNNTPNHVAVSKVLAAIEGGEAALITASGMAAISTALLTVLKAGDHLLVQECLYGGTHTFVTGEMPGYGISFDFINAGDPADWRRKLKPNTRAIYVETMSNPLLQVPDHRKVVDFAREHGLVSLIDNTLASAVNFRPLALGYDLSLHSCTKYLNGHSDIVAGAIIGATALVERVNHKLIHLGGCLDPHACFLLERGIKTLALRMHQHNENGQRIAEFLRSHSKVERVMYPGLPDHPDHALAHELLEGFGGLLSFELQGGAAPAQRFMERLELPICAPSLGGVESLITRPVTTSHSGVAPDDRRRLGISDGLIRFAAGIEAAEDLIEDLAQALAAT
ncbi:MAG TPA: aminotransferase class I/II-fold pyridoxal phosphate-dependent enzyme [Candidatus Binataceae bacterium]|jgi:cystathionine beta-lyase/cystathionine gamma-synthase|nr:aminotransferase class I/II-fold pyridoxal phosphate-dependent enzyme [Candidatus Binataceae bacterium]